MSLKSMRQRLMLRRAAIVRVLVATRHTAGSAWRLARDVRRGAGSLLLPPSCAACAATFGSDAEPTGESFTVLLCDECREQLGRGFSACPCCASRDIGTASDGRCMACRDRKFRFSWAVALGAYEGPLREAVLRTKNPTQHCLTVALAELLWLQHGQRLSGFSPDAVVAVPMHWRHRVWRGGNGPDLVCETIARRLGVQSAPNLLARRRNTLPQSNLAHGRRKSNVRHAFRVRSSYVLDGARLILVDDILTSGATVHEAAATLRAAGAAEVAVAVIARADRPA